MLRSGRSLKGWKENFASVCVHSTVHVYVYTYVWCSWFLCDKMAYIYVKNIYITLESVSWYELRYICVVVVCMYMQIIYTYVIYICCERNKIEILLLLRNKYIIANKKDVWSCWVYLLVCGGCTAYMYIIEYMLIVWKLYLVGVYSICGISRIYIGVLIWK
jgi:hypothetical protein